MKTNDTIRTITGKLSTVFSSEPTVRLAFLFGSQARGSARASSDYDIAIYLDIAQNETVDDIQLYRYTIKLQNQMEEALGKRVDLVLLNTAPPAIAAEALRGIPLLLRDEPLYLDLLCEKTREAEDLMEWTFDLIRLRRRLRKETI